MSPLPAQGVDVGGSNLGPPLTVKSALAGRGLRFELPGPYGERVTSAALDELELEELRDLITEELER